MKKLFYVFVVIALILILPTVFAKNQTIANFNGTWGYTTENSQFDLILTQNANVLTGSHCSAMLSGNKSDCGIEASDLSISAIVSDPIIVTVNFKSYFSGLSGRATISKLSDTQIKWTIIEKPKGEYYLPEVVTLIKK